MSRYALTTAGELIVSWRTGSADHAVVITRAVPTETATESAIALAAALTTLSAQLWRTYTHPASAVPDDGDNSEHWRRTQHRASLDTVVDVVAAPNLPDEHGNLLSSYDTVVATADQVGRVLRQLDDAALTGLIRDDVADEVAAVRHAELGDLTSRAAQAVALSRAEASPAQVAAAHEVFARNPLGDLNLFQDFEPAAACVAAAHWLYTAATLTAEDCGYEDPAELIRDADDIEALPVRVPMVVVNRMSEGQSAHCVVTELIAEALTTADGQLADPNRLVAQIDQALSEAARFAHREDVDEIRASLLSDICVCLLDPDRPGPDLLEDLLAGIHACWLMYAETSDLDHDEAHDEFLNELRQTAAHTHPD